MNNHLEPVNGNITSPFDAIKRTTTDGQEYWSARDLMPLMGYSAWQKFEVPLKRAMKSAENQGQTSAFTRTVNRVQAGTGSTEKVDFHLSRFAAYLVAMNGDPNKPEVAAAQAYFAIQTHVAETTKSPAELTRREILTMALEAEERAELEAARAEAAEQRAEAEATFRHAIEAGDGITISDFGKKYFSEIPERAFFNHLYDNGWLIDQRNTGQRKGNGKKKYGPDHRKPTYKGRSYLYLHDMGVHGGKRRLRTRVRPQSEIALRDALNAEGLEVNRHSTGLFKLIGVAMKVLP